MSDLSEKIEVVQVWINSLRENQATNAILSDTLEKTLNDVLKSIKPHFNETMSKSDISETYVEFEKQIQEQTIALAQATAALKAQIHERELAVQKLQKAYNDLENHLQEHLAYQSMLNQHLQEKIDKQMQNEALQQEERILTDALRDTLATISSTLDLDKILDHILDTVKRITPYDGANILLVESDLVHVARQRGYVNKEMEKDWLNQRIPLTKLAILQKLMDVGKPLAIGDTGTSPMWMGFPGLEWVNSNVIAPIRSNGKVLGFLSLDSATPGYFTQAHADRLQSFADQAAIAIQNARLLDRAKQAAVMAERNRLANELHDTISQTLWSMSLISERLPTIWEIDKEEGRRSLATMHQLSQNALSEMRSLLLELHPSSLADAKLGDLIRHLAEIITNRTGLEVSVRVDNHGTAPSHINFAFYRVVQEALNNVILHASATHVVIYLKSKFEGVQLTIQDNGIGFDPSEVGSGHLGLSIMHDRIQSIAGTLDIVSNAEQGTLIKIEWVAPTD